MAYTSTTLGAVLRAQVSTNIEVPAEPVGCLDACNLKFDDKRASLSEVVVVPVVPAQSADDMTPAATPPAGGAITPYNAQVQITKVRQVSAKFTGEDLRQLDNTDTRQEMLTQFIGQGERTLRNEMSAAAAVALKINSSRAVGSAGKVPFSKDMSVLTQARRILRDNGAPMGDIHCAVPTGAYQNLLNLNTVQKAQESGSDAERRSGIIKAQQGIVAIHEDANIADHTAGTGGTFQAEASTAYPTGQTGSQAVGTYGVGLDTGTGSINLGDVVAFAAVDANNLYCVNPLRTLTTAYQTIANYTTPTRIDIGNPGLRTAIADNAVLSIKTGTTEAGTAGYSPSFVFARHAIVGVIRPPLGFDVSGIITQSNLIKDSYGYNYLFIESSQWGQISWFVCVAYGFKVTQSEFVCTIMG